MVSLIIDVYVRMNLVSCTVSYHVGLNIMTFANKSDTSENEQRSRFINYLKDAEYTPRFVMIIASCFFNIGSRHLESPRVVNIGLKTCFV